MATDTRTEVERLTRRILIEDHGTDAITKRPISSTFDLEVERPADYLAGIQAARRVADFAESLMRDYAKRARGEGVA